MFRRIWIAFLISAASLIAVDVVYLKWRERSLEPLRVPVDLSRPGKYNFHASGFHASSYHPSFRLQLPFKTDVEWNFGHEYQRIWGETAPEIALEIRDRSGQRVLMEQSSLTRTAGWVVTGGLRASVVEMYKLTQYEAGMFGSYSVSLHVLRGSANSSRLNPNLTVSAIKAYALLPSAVGFVALLLLVGFIAIGIGVAQYTVYRRSLRRTGAAS